MTPDQIRESTFEGWVAWLDGTPAYVNGQLVGYDVCTPIFEAVPHNPALLPVVPGTHQVPVRQANRNTLDWKLVPHERIVQLELYAFRGAYPKQPVIQITKLPGHDMRWIQFKRGGIVVPAAMHAGETMGQRRLGTTAYVIGYWDRTVGEARLLEVSARGGKIEQLGLDGRNHPCWPRPLGFGISPVVLGLKTDDVPAPPPVFATPN